MQGIWAARPHSKHHYLVAAGSGATGRDFACRGGMPRCAADGPDGMWRVSQGGMKVRNILGLVSVLPENPPDRCVDSTRTGNSRPSTKGSACFGASQHRCDLSHRWQEWVFEAQTAIALRTLGLMGLLPAAPGENPRIVVEKVKAIQTSVNRAAELTAAGQPAQAILRALGRPIAVLPQRTTSA